MNKKLRELNLTDIDVHVLNNALTAYANEFKKTVDTLEEKTGRISFLGRGMGELQVHDIRIKLGLDKPIAEKSILMYVEPIV